MVFGGKVREGKGVIEKRTSKEGKSETGSIIDQVLRHRGINYEARHKAYYQDTLSPTPLYTSPLPLLYASPSPSLSNTASNDIKLYRRKRTFLFPSPSTFVLTSAQANIAPATGPTTTTQVPPTTQAAPAAEAKVSAGAKEPPKPYYRFDVKMTCSGCSGAIDRVLKKNITSRTLPVSRSSLFSVLTGCTANEYSVSLEDQTAFVWGPSLPPIEDVKAKIAKTGKEVRPRPLAEANARSANQASGRYTRSSRSLNE
jgi:copper chaperone